MNLDAIMVQLYVWHIFAKQVNWIEQGWRGPGISLILSPSCANGIKLYKSFFSCTMRAMVLLIFQCPIFSPTYNTSNACFCSHRDGRCICACNRWMHRCASPKKREIIEHSKEIKPVNPKGNQPWIFIRRTDAEAAILWPPDAKSQLIGKDPDTGKDWGQEEKGATEDDVIGWHHWLKGREYAQAPGDGEGQGSLACCSPWNRRVGHDLAAGQQQRRTPIYWALLLCRCQFVPFMWIISNNWDTTTLIYRYKNWS